MGQQKTLVIPKNPKVGLSLSGGGAKGFAHIGVIKVLDSLGIKIDYVGGTSMGAIIGGMYAAGYSGKEMEAILEKTDVGSILLNDKQRSEVSFFSKSNEKYFISFPIKKNKIQLPSSLSNGQRTIYFLNDLFKDVRSVKDFRQLPIPFLCVATNLETGQAKVFEEGEITDAIMASAAFPSLLDPIKIGDSLYIDGGVSINYPSELLKKKGMDIVIGVNLNQGLEKVENLSNFIKVLSQIINYGIQKNYREQQDFTEIDIKPNLEGKSMMNFENKKEIIDSGYAKALEYLPLFEKLPKTSFVKIKHSISRNPILSTLYKIDQVILKNSNRFDVNYAKGKMRLKTPSLVSFNRLNKMIDRLYSTGNYKLIRYEINQDNGNTLKLDVTESSDYNFIKVGLHYDKIFSSGLLLNYTSRKFIFHNSNLSLDVVFGNSPRYYFNYFIDNGYIPGLGLNSSALSFNFIDSDQKNLLNNWSVFRNEVYLESILSEIIAFGGGFSYDYLEKNKPTTSVQKEKFINPYFFIKSDTQDDSIFPTRGVFFNTEIKFFNINNTSKKEKGFQIQSRFKFNYPLSKIISLQSDNYLGLTFDKAPDIYLYRFGGLFHQKILNFHSFTGQEIGNIISDNILSLNSSIQIQLFKNYYIIPNIQLLSTFKKIEDFGVLKFNHKNIGISGAYNSIIGEIRLNYSQDFMLKKGILNFTFGYWF